MKIPRLTDETPLDPCCEFAVRNAVHEAGQQHDAALLNERHRMVTEAVAALTTYSEALLTLPLDPYNTDLINRVTAAAIRAIRAVACICPQINIGTLGDPDRTTLGYARLCGIHGKALGGPVTGGKTYLIGESGPEL